MGVGFKTTLRNKLWGIPVFVRLHPAQCAHMKIKHLIRSFVCWAVRPLSSVGRHRSPDDPSVEQLSLDQLTEGDLPLRDALPVRSAELWLQLGYPHLALKELAALPETVRQHPWPVRVQLAAHHAANPATS